ncbi:MAG: hypothetical protein ACF8R7_03105 [Phycisphaerales bacterium JB039]
MLWMWVTLGQTGGSAALPRLLVSLGLMIAAVVVLGVILVALRRRLLAPQRDQPAGMFEDLRRMLKEGRITQEEYDAVRRRVASRIAGARDRADSPPEDR